MELTDVHIDFMHIAFCLENTSQFLDWNFVAQHVLNVLLRHFVVQKMRDIIHTLFLIEIGLNFGDCAWHVRNISF